MKQGKNSSGGRSDPPALTPEARQAQLIAKAERLAEKKLEDGTASPQIIVHYLRLATEREKKQTEALEAKIALDKAKVQQIESMAKMDELFGDAMAMFKVYSGGANDEEYVDEDL